MPLDPLTPLLLPPRLPLVALRPLLPVGPQSIFDCATEPLPALSLLLRAELLVLPVLSLELLLLELELPLPFDRPGSNAASGQSALERALLLLRPDVLPEFPSP